MNLKTVDDRFKELEERIEFLEEELKKLQKEQKTVTSSISVTENILTAEEKLLLSSNKVHVDIKDTPSKSPVQRITEDIPIQPQKSKTSSTVSTFLRKKKDGESLIGKYIIGALASLLVFIGAASFIAIVWHKISPEMKVFIIGLSGFILTIIGLKTSLKKTGPIPSILLGTGSGLMYIAILSASLAFHLISHWSSSLFCALWTILLILSYCYTQLFFTVIIAYIGSYVNLLFELKYIDLETDAFLIFTFITAISMIIIYTLRKSGKIRYGIGIALSALSFLTLFLYLDFLNVQIEFYKVMTAIVVAIFLLKNLLYRLAQVESIPSFYLILSFLSTAVLSILLTEYWRIIFDLTVLQILFILFAVHFIQIFSAPHLYPNIFKSLNVYYGLILYLCTILIHYKCLDLFSGATVMAIFFLLQKKIWKVPVEPILIAGMLALDTILFFITGSSWKLVFVVTNTLILFALPKLSEKLQHRLSFRNFSMILLLFACKIVGDALPKWVMETYKIYGDISMIEMSLWHMLSVLALILLYRIGYFKFDKETEKDIPMKKGYPLQNYYALLIVAAIFFIVGAINLNIEYSLNSLPELTLAFTTLVVSLLQSRIIWKHGNENKELLKVEGIWLLVRYILYSGNGVLNLIFACGHFALLFYILKKSEPPIRVLFTKNLTLIILLLSYFSFSEQFVSWFNINDIAPAIGVLLAIVTLLTIYSLKYFSKDDEEVLTNGKTKYSLSCRYYHGLYFCAVALYFYGIFVINTTNGAISKVILTLSLLATALLQTHISFSNQKKIPSVVACWIVLKYLVLTWSLINAFLALPAESVIYSVSGLLIAVVSIYAGFKVSVTMIRHFGLGLALLMVTKFIFVDLSGENSITRVIAFVVGGVLCFIISIIYNKLSKTKEE